MINKSLKKLSFSIVLAAILGATNVYGVCGGDIDMGENKITSSASPTEDNDLTNKLYVDAKINTSLFDPAILAAKAAGYDVIEALDNRTWLDRNLGASRVATSIDDILAYGGYYQWGRKADGHEVRGTLTTEVKADVPTHTKFILGGNGNDWRENSSDLLWDGVYAVNNPCPMGFRVPSMFEFATMIEKENIFDTATGFSNHMKFPTTGFRVFDGGNIIFDLKITIWTASLSALSAKYYTINSTSTGTSTAYRASGIPIRCIKH
jgi:uncharacterized protein (TIGR02145 family)